LAPNDQSTIDNLGKLRNTVKQRGKSWEDISIFCYIK
jgi:hypothetical protein